MEKEKKKQSESGSYRTLSILKERKKRGRTDKLTNKVIQDDIQSIC